MTPADIAAVECSMCGGAYCPETCLIFGRAANNLVLPTVPDPDWAGGRPVPVATA